MGYVTKDIPKPMISLARKPILEYQIELSKRYGVKDLIILTGYKHEVIESYFKDGSKWGVNIDYSHEIIPLGTAGALKEIESNLKDDFLVFYGDVIMDVDLDSFISFHLEKKSLATIAVHPNDHPQDSDLVEVNEKGRVIAFHSKPHNQGKFYRNLVNAAFYIFSPSILKYIKKGKYSDFGRDIFPKMLDSGEYFYAYNTTEYIKDIGTKARLKAVENDVMSGKVTRLNKTNLQKAVFIDRDGVLNKEVDNLSNLRDFELLSGVVEALKKLNKSNYLSVVVTNQPVIAKGFASEEDLYKIHCYMESLLGDQHAYIDRIYYCPHHPDKGFEGERKKYKIECNCRKPKTGMIEQAKKDMNIDLEKSFIIGDRTVDIITGINAGLKTILVKTGYGGEDGKYQCEPDFIFEDLNEAVDFIVNKYNQLFGKIESCIPFDVFRNKRNPLISISGLSRSGKSTLSKIVDHVLNTRGLQVKILKLDNWLISVDKRESWMSVRDRYQYNKVTVDIQNLLKGNKIRVEGYNPKTRTVGNKVHEFSLNEGELLIVDGVVGLDVDILRNIADMKFYTEIPEENRRRRFYDFYRYKGLAEDLIDNLYLDRQHDEYTIIVESEKYADHIINMEDYL